MHEAAVSENGDEFSERVEHAAGNPPLCRKGFAKAEADGKKDNPDQKQDKENAFPVGIFHHKAADDGRDDRSQSVDDHQK